MAKGTKPDGIYKFVKKKKILPTFICLFFSSYSLTQPLHHMQWH